MALAEDWEKALSYGTGIGHPGLCEWVAQRHGGLDDGQVMVANGSLEAGWMLFEHLLEPGDRVVVEQPTYDRTLLMLQRLGVELVPVPLEDDGLDIAAFEAALAEGPIKLAHVIPNFHNPAGCTLSAEKRVRLVELAAEHDFSIFEDDPYRELPFEGEALETMLSIDKADKVVHASSFSKTVSPGVRVGYLAGPGGGDRQARQAGQRDLHLAQHAGRGGGAQLCRSGGLDRNIEFVKGALRARRDALVEALERADPRGRVRRPRRRLLPLARPRRGHRHRRPAGRGQGRGRRLRRRPRLHDRGRRPTASASPSPACRPSGSPRASPASPALWIAFAPALPPERRSPASIGRPPARRLIQPRSLPVGGVDDLSATEEEAWLWLTNRARWSASPATRCRDASCSPLTGGSAALAAFLAACGSDSSSTTTTIGGAAGGNTGTEQFGKGDVGILNYALTLEYLETAFYADVVKSGLFKGSDLATIRKFGSEEAEHVAALTGFVKQLGGKPAPKPKTEFPLKSAKSVLELARPSRTSAPPPTWARRPTSRAPRCSPRRSRSTASRAATRRRSTPCWAKSITPDGAFAKPPAPTKSSSRSNPSSSADRRAKRERRTR